MDIIRATKAFAALSQETRLCVFRHLVQIGGDGMPAGEIARKFETPHNTMSTHLAALVASGLVASKRQGRSVFYMIDLDGTKDLMGFLMEDCCQGRADLCAPLLDSLMPNCCDQNLLGNDQEMKAPNI
ncbi:MAG: helix-turn-helix transcriptional regulator [Sneathiella sp.]|nr:helix-turn-helix transcriptional regulator [Sneathiella sp.]